MAPLLAALSERRDQLAGKESYTTEDQGLQLPREVGTAQAGKILGVGKDTVLNYKKKGLLPYRDAAPPGSTRSNFKYPLDAVVKLRTTYQTDDPAPEVPREAPRRV